MEIPLWITYHEGDSERECAVEFLSPWLSFIFTYTPVCLIFVWCFQIVISAKHTECQQLRLSGN